MLNRNTLELQDNSSVLLQSSAIAGMQSNFEALTDGSLVIVALPASAGAIPSSLVTPLNNALGEIGAVLPGRWALQNQMTLCWSSQTPDCFSAGWSTFSVTYGSFSVIGVPGLAVGNAWYDSAAQRGTIEGPLVGYLTPGTTVGGGANADAYTLVFGADEYVLVDSCVTGGPSACVMAWVTDLPAPGSMASTS